MDKSYENLACEIVANFERLSGARGTWESHWAEIADRLIPSHRNKFTARGNTSTPGAKNTEFIFDSTASVALDRFAAILDSLLTPRNSTWHRLMASDPVLNRDRQVKLWFEEVNRLLFKYRYAPKANFASQNQQNYLSLGAYGSGCVFIDKLHAREGGIRYRNIHLGEVYFQENHQGIVDSCYRYFAVSARNAKQKPEWAKELPARIKDCTNPDQEFMFIHCVMPRTDKDPKRVDFKGMDFASYYVNVEEKKIVEERGHNVFPYGISRYQQAPNETYGRSPAMSVLPAIKTLNEEKKTLLKQGHRALDPILLIHDDGIADGFSMRPGALNPGAITADGRPLVQALQTGNIAVGKDLMDDERIIINDAFLVRIFQILTETPAMTATEVMERTKEKGILLAPTIGRQQSEYLGPTIERELDVLAEQRMLPPMPRALIEAKGEFRIEYDSPLSRAQRAEEASGLMRTIEVALNVVNVTQNMEPLDHFNWDVIMPAVGEIQGVPYQWMKSMEQVAMIRAQRAEQAQMQTAIQAGPSAAAMMKAGAAVQK